MKELSFEIHVLLNSAAQNIVLAADEYIDPADSLIHCKSCGGRRQAVIHIHGIAEHFTPRCLCPCQTTAEQRRKEAEEQRKRIERIRRRREQGLQDRHLYNYTFANDNGQNPLMEKARSYVDGWDKAYASNKRSSICRRSLLIIHLLTLRSSPPSRTRRLIPPT